MLRCFCVGLLWLCVVSAGEAVAESVSLRPVFVEGETRVYEEWVHVVTTTDVRYPGGNNLREEEVEVELEVFWEVLRVRRDGAAEVRVTTRWLDYTMTTRVGGQSQTLEVDTRRGRGEPEALYEAIEELVENPLTYTIAADGSVEEIEGLDRLRLRIEAFGRERVDREGYNGLAGGQQPGEIPMSLAPGGRWRQSVEGYAFEGIETESTVDYELEAVRDIEGVPVAIVKASATPKLTPPDLPAGPDGQRPAFQPEAGRYTSDLFFDMDAGLLTARNSTQETGYSLRVMSPNGAINVQRAERVQSQLLMVERQAP
ncbi:hypothetical protein [Mucisphaera sp.]|uniref:hypothetical protein n=1 Tax=Mucisphaera sp. TaxID=2913024 RepID=UPI003D0EC387